VCSPLRTHSARASLIQSIDNTKTLILGSVQDTAQDPPTSQTCYHVPYPRKPPPLPPHPRPQFSETAYIGSGGLLTGRISISKDAFSGVVYFLRFLGKCFPQQVRMPAIAGLWVYFKDVHGQIRRIFEKIAGKSNKTFVLGPTAAAPTLTFPGSQR